MPYADFNIANGHCVFSLKLDKKLEALPSELESEINLDPVGRQKSNCTIFLGYTSNMISSGVRETFRYLAEHNMASTWREVSWVTISYQLFMFNNYRRQ